MVKFDEFKIPSNDEWIEILKKELKGENPEEKLLKHDEIEDISFKQFLNKNDIIINNEVPNIYPFKRAFKSEINNFGIVHSIKVRNENEDNKKLLELLMNGIDSIHLIFEQDRNYNFKKLIENIKLDIITLFIESKFNSVLNECLTYIKTIKYSNVILLNNPQAINDKNFEIVNDIKKVNFKLYNVDAYSIKECGANAIQELCFSLCSGHQYLFELLKENKDVELANSKISFSLGIGSNFFIEIAKFRAFRVLWSKILYSYSNNKSINNTTILALTGFVNKSLKDPYTNLLRQSTEVLSAILGGADYINNQAYDSYSVSSSSFFAERMAKNISLILKEESFINKVIDSAGGSYFVEYLTMQIIEKTWKLFQEYDGDNWKNSNLFNIINETRKKRIEMLNSNKINLIGVNKFENNVTTNYKWIDSFESYFSLSRLILEKEYNGKN